MGKYDEHAYEHVTWTEYQEAKVQLVAAIANELAEANRLKRFELSQRYGDYELVDGLKKWVTPSELEDQS